MGSATLFEDTRQTKDNKKFHFAAWCFLEELSHPKDSDASIIVKEVGVKDLPYWGLTVCLSDFNEKWMERWVEAFCTQPNYREKFLIESEDSDIFSISSERTNQKTGEITHQSSLPSIPALSQDEMAMNVSNAVQKLIKLGKNAKFKDFAALRSGRDAFSSVKLPVLIGKIGNQAEKLNAIDLDDENKAKVARWMLRGLNFNLALHKVKVDLEITANAHR